MGVRKLEPGDEAVLREIRLRALADAPEAFDSTHDQQQAWTPAEWRQRLAVGATFVYETPSGLAGMAGGVPNRDEPNSVFLVGVWVHPDHRGTGAGDALVKAVLDWARSQGTPEVLLHVMKDANHPRRLYERNGFRATGEQVFRERDGAPELEMRIRL
jgi:GNAT superfamily N-acetyltransferase